MAVYSFHKETGRYLTSIGGDVKPGDIVHLSVGHPIFGGEFTGFKLGPVVAVNNYGNLFDLENEALIEVKPDWNSAPEYVSRQEIRDAIEASTYDGGMILRGQRYKRTGFGNWRVVK